MMILKGFIIISVLFLLTFVKSGKNCYKNVKWPNTYVGKYYNWRLCESKNDCKVGENCIPFTECGESG